MVVSTMQKKWAASSMTEDAAFILRIGGLA